jgi:4-hydroxy-tetrahydrodipicolinate synthase
MPIEHNNNASSLKGVVVPMITPLCDDFTIDKDAVARIVERFIKAGVFPFVLGTTGESASMTGDQKKELVKATVDAAEGRKLVYAGISGNSLQTSVDEGKLFAELGADILVATPPGYYPVNDVQLEKYFLQLTDALPLPLVLYNMPATTRCSISIELIEKLSKHPNIVGLKDSERDESRINMLSGLFRDRDDFALLIGWAAQSVNSLQKGYDGIVPSTANFVPEIYHQLFVSVKQNDTEKANYLQELTNEISTWYQKDKILSESIPMLKLACSVSGLCGPQVLPPMYRQGQEEEQESMELLRKKIENIDKK